MMFDQQDPAVVASNGVTVGVAMLAAKGRGDDAELLRLANDTDTASIRYASLYLAQAVYETLVTCGVKPRQARRQLARLADDVGLKVDAVETALMVSAAAAAGDR